MSFIMKIIFATEPIKYPLTGIGRYSLELVKRLAVAREIEELKLFHGASFIEQIPLVENKSDTKASNHGRGGGGGGGRGRRPLAAKFNSRRL